ncbi:unnamed protein product, partial [Didymodactylos carnosus]
SIKVDLECVLMIDSKCKITSHMHTALAIQLANGAPEITS